MLDLGELDVALAPDLEARRAAAAARAATWRAQLPGPLGELRAQWWDARARTKTYSERVAACGKVGRACEHCGMVLLRKCGATMVCHECSSSRWTKVRNKLARALAGHLAVKVEAWRRRGRPGGQEPRLALLTLTLKHSGNVTADREHLSLSWHRWRAAWRERTGENLAYAWSVEYTPGRDDLGHVHMHVTTIMPWVDLREEKGKPSPFRASWIRATGGQGTRIHVSSKTRGVRDAAKYLAKYATKGTKGLTVEHAAMWMRAQHGKRACSTSRHFFAPDPASKHGPWSQWASLASVAASCATSLPRATDVPGLVPLSRLHPSARDGPVPF